MRELHIAYRCGEHYDSVRRLNDNSEAPAHLQTDVSEASVFFCILSPGELGQELRILRLKPGMFCGKLSLRICGLD